MFHDSAVLNVATRRVSGVGSYRVLIRLLALAALNAGVVWPLCIDDPCSFFIANAARILTVALAAPVLWVACRKKLASPVYIAFGSRRGGLPRLRGPSPGAALALVRARPGRASSDGVIAAGPDEPRASQ